MDQSILQSIIECVALIHWSPWVTAGATIVLAVLTYRYVRLTGKILATQSEPCVILTVVHDDDRATVLQLVARNVGTGLAHDIRFEFSRPLPARAFGLSESDARKVTGNNLTIASGPDVLWGCAPRESRLCPCKS